MFAVDHAATALLIKRRFPSVPLTPLLVSVQAMELAWVGLNYLGVERTTTEATVRSVSDIHLAYMPFGRDSPDRRRAGMAGRGTGARSTTVGPGDRRRDRLAPGPRPVDTCTRHCALAGQHTPGNRTGPVTIARRCGASLSKSRMALCVGVSIEEAGPCSR